MDPVRLLVRDRTSLYPYMGFSQVSLLKKDPYVLLLTLTRGTLHGDLGYRDFRTIFTFKNQERGLGDLVLKTRSRVLCSKGLLRLLVSSNSWLREKSNVYFLSTFLNGFRCVDPSR